MMRQLKKFLADAKGQLGFDMSALIGMFLGIGVLILVLILVGVIGSKAYKVNEQDINSITNATIKDNVQTSITNVFGALKDSSSFVTIIVLTIIMGIVLVVLGSATSGVGGYRGAF